MGGADGSEHIKLNRVCERCTPQYSVIDGPSRLRARISLIRVDLNRLLSLMLKLRVPRADRCFVRAS